MRTLTVSQPRALAAQAGGVAGVVVAMCANVGDDPGADEMDVGSADDDDDDSVDDEEVVVQACSRRRRLIRRRKAVACRGRLTQRIAKNSAWAPTLAALRPQGESIAFVVASLVQAQRGQLRTDCD